MKWNMSTISDIAPLHLKYTPELYLRGRLSPIYPSFTTPGATPNKKWATE